MFQTRQHLRYKPIIFCVCLFVVFSLFLRYCFHVAFVFFFFFFLQAKACRHKQRETRKIVISRGLCIANSSRQNSDQFQRFHNYIWKVKRFVQGFHRRTNGIFFGLFVCLNYLFIYLTLYQPFFTGCLIFHCGRLVFKCTGDEVGRSRL